MSDDLVAFLRARLDEDEQTARAVEDRSAPWDGQWVADGTDALRTYNGHVLFYGHNWPLKPGLVAHVARHDPARVLAEVAAKRALVRIVFQYEATIDGEWGCGCNAAQIEAGLCPERHPDNIDALRLLAAPYAAHPGYRPEWAPDA